ncbi:hypothetical protein B0T10DRAFT_555629 [Thelonectria olida]|uniref:HMG box domain-containing protein n=1 Tax=Thelonectria olida TaxID=1576542 RepID=A0A9P8WG92_9HYPO|nr:hypothetical protein B0T10DRAFT_555629 [Thelonectria olida]
MASELETIFTELGLTQYLDAFVDQGFDEWDIILDIQESDLDVLGVKLGHRRKLQRRIANARGISPSAALVSPVRPTSEEIKHETPRTEPSRPESTQEVQGVTKRKYRRHPKSDENAPERPPSAYVLFSNKMREDLKSQNLSFTEIAKLVGENWQNLPGAEKEAYEGQANSDKEKYHRELVEYKKTSEYKKYTRYLQEFKEKQAKQSQASDVSKRLKLRNGSSTSGTATPGGTTLNGHTSGSGSGSERVFESEPPFRKERLGSVASIAESQHSTAHTMVSQTNSNEDTMSSPRGGPYDAGSPKESHHQPPRRQGSWREGTRGVDGPHQHLPSLSDMLDDGRRAIPPPPTENNATHLSTGFVAANHPRSFPEMSNGLHGTATPRGPLLRHDHSSNSSVGSISPGVSFARTPGEGPLPIHALLSHQTSSAPALGAFDRGSPNPMVGAATPSPTDPARLPFGRNVGPRGYGT